MLVTLDLKRSSLSLPSLSATFTAVKQEKFAIISAKQNTSS